MAAVVSGFLLGRCSRGPLLGDVRGLRVVAPSTETLLELVRACGFDLPLEFVPRDAFGEERLRKNALLSPERRVHRFLQARSKAGRAS